MLGIEKRPLSEQMYFWGQGDLMYAECSPEYAKDFAERIKREALYALKNGNRFSDCSELEGANLACALDWQKENDERTRE